jgi:hypothetical protein
LNGQTPLEGIKKKYQDYVTAGTPKMPREGLGRVWRDAKWRASVVTTDDFLIQSIGIVQGA